MVKRTIQNQAGTIRVMKTKDKKDYIIYKGRRILLEDIPQTKLEALKKDKHYGKIKRKPKVKKSILRKKFLKVARQYKTRSKVERKLVDDLKKVEKEYELALFKAKTTATSELLSKKIEAIESIVKDIKDKVSELKIDKASKDIIEILKKNGYKRLAIKAESEIYGKPTPPPTPPKSPKLSTPSSSVVSLPSSSPDTPPSRRKVPILDFPGLKKKPPTIMEADSDSEEEKEAKTKPKKLSNKFLGTVSEQQRRSEAQEQARLNAIDKIDDSVKMIDKLLAESEKRRAQRNSQISLPSSSKYYEVSDDQGFNEEGGGPDDVDDGDDEGGLYGWEINEILDGYPGFLGCFNLKTLHNIIPHQPIFSLVYLIERESGVNHWVAMFCDIEKKEFDYYNSLGEPAEKKIVNFFHRLFQKYEIPKTLDWKNNLVRQQGESSNCGLFAAHFIVQRTWGHSFGDITGFKNIPKFEQEMMIAKNNFQV